MEITLTSRSTSFQRRPASSLMRIPVAARPTIMWASHSKSARIKDRRFAGPFIAGRLVDMPEQPEIGR
jgi:hypothetical protein